MLVSSENSVDVRTPNCRARNIAGFETFFNESLNQTTSQRYKLTRSPAINILSQTHIIARFYRKIRRAFLRQTTARAARKFADFETF